MMVMMLVIVMVMMMMMISMMILIHPVDSEVGKGRVGIVSIYAGRSLVPSGFTSRNNQMRGVWKANRVGRRGKVRLSAR